MATWTFDLKCPRCGAENQIVTENNTPPPAVRCGDCLVIDTINVEFDIMRASVNVEGKV